MEGIKLVNIDLSGVSVEMQLDKINEEFKEFGESYAEYLMCNTQQTKEHVIEEYYDLLQATLGILDKVGITAEEVMQGYPKHLLKLEHRPRSCNNCLLVDNCKEDKEADKCQIYDDGVR